MNDFGWLDELPDYGAAPAAESVVAPAAPAAPAAEPLPIPEVPVKSAAVSSAELDAFVLAGRYDTPEIRETLARNKELEGLAARRRKLDGLNSRAVAGQTVLRYAFPELKGEPGAYFMKQGKELPECQTRTDAFAAVYDDYLAGVEAEYKKLLERRAAWQAHKVEVSQAVVDVVAGRTAPAALHERLTPEQMEVYQKEFDADATEKAGVAMGLLREAFAGDAETGLKNMVNQGLANRVTAALSDLNEDGELVLNEKAVGMFQGALTALMQEAKGKSGEEYKFLHNLLVGLGNPVRRRSKDIQGVLGLMVQADTAAALAMAGRKGESQEVQEQMQEDIEELRGRWRNDEVYARLRGMLDAAQSEGNATAETADFLAKSVNVLGSVVGQTAPFFVPGVGAGIAFLQAFDEKRNAAYFKGLKPGTAEWSAFIDAATSVAVEKIAFGSVSRVSGTVKLLEKVPGYGPVRNALLGSFYWRAVAEVGAGVLEESAVEPSAEALLQWMIRGGASVWGDVGGRYDWAKYAEELKGMFQPEQLAATVIFGAGLTGMQSPLIKDAAKGYSRHVEYLMGQGIGREEARNISAMEDAEERVKAAAAAKAEAWKDPEVAKANQRAAAVAFAEIAEARAVVESRAYAELRQELRLPEVEKVADKEGRYLITTYNRVDGTELYRGEVGEEQLLAMLNHYIKQEDDLRVRRAQSAMGANAMLRAVEATGEVVVEDMGAAKNPESGERVISELGAMGEAEFRYAAELALDEFEARKAAGMSEGEALATPFEALSRYMPLGSWLKLEAAFKQRLATAGETSGEEGADATRLLNTVPAAGTTKADSLFLAATGQVGAREVLEDTLEHKQKKVTGNDPAKLQAWHRLLKDAQKEVRRLGFNLSFYQGEDGMDAAALQEKVTEGMSKLASAHVLANADALPLPAWVKELLRWHMAALEDAAGIVVLAEAYRQGRERGNIGQEIEEVLADLGKKVASMYAQAELTEADVQAYRDARARYKELTGDVTPSAEEVRAEQDAADARERERVTAEVDTKSVIPPSDDERTDAETFSQAGDLPEEVRGVFPKGASYNIGARTWLGMVPVARLHLSPDAPQVKVGSNKKGVVNPLVGDYRADAPPVYVWQRKNGTLEVISGRHRLDLAKRTGTEMIAAYVYQEDLGHDAKWARLLDFEQNMQDDQADELTAAIYVRETGLNDEELTRRGLTRGGSRSARGILIGREAREDLWSRFQSRAIDPRTAEAICRLTMHMPDKGRIDAMQAMAAADLARGKSLEHVAAKLQLMAHADADGEAQQGLLSFGESFDEAMERSAEYIARCIEVINRHISAVTKARSLGKGGVSEQEGISVGLDVDPKKRLVELNELKAAYEKCGFHENIRFRALTWDGRSDVDPIGDYAKDKAAAAALEGPTAEELEAQAREAAAEATGTFGFSVITQKQLVDSLKAKPELQGFMDCVQRVEQMKERNSLDRKEYFFGALPAKVINEVQKELPANIDLAGARLSLNAQDVWHMYRGHCLDSFMYDDQVSITFDDIRMIPDIIDSYDSVKAEKESGKWKLVFLKKYGDITYKYISEISRKHDWPKVRHATLKTGWLIKSTGAEGDFTSRQSQTQTVSHFPRTAIVTPLEVHIKQNYKDEARNIALYAKNHDTALIAPNGKVSNLTPVQWLAVRLQSFKTWFGDWENDPENASKIVDENGEPLVVYHGSPHYGFTVFDKARRGERDKGDFGRGFYFTPNRGYAATYGKEGYWNAEGDDSKVYACFLNIREPMQVQARQAENMERWRFEDAEGVMVYTDKFYDLAWNDVKNLSEIVVHESNQIKSATDNRGTFDGGSEDINFSVVGQGAANWDKIKHRAFKGRDDGKLRVEIDASQAQVVSGAFDTEAQKAFRRILTAAYYEEIPEEKSKPILDYAQVLEEYRAAEHRLIMESSENEERNAALRGAVRALKKKSDELRWTAYEMLKRLFAAEGVERFDFVRPTDMDVLVTDFLKQESWESDAAAELLEGVRPVFAVNLSEILDYPELYEAYPQLADIRVYREKQMLHNASGYVSESEYRDSIHVWRGLSAWKLRSTLLHEVQHLIQKIEGFAKGGNLARARAYINNMASQGNAYAMELKGLTDYELYRRLAGEIESRNVESRSWWSAEKRAQVPFNDMLEFPGEALVAFSVIGPKAKTWDRYKERAFKGRDDGKMRVEIDASQAKLKKAPLHRLDDSLVREVERRLAFFRDELEKRKRWEIVSKLWAAGEYDLRTYDEMSFLRRVLHGAGIEFRNIPQMAELGVCALALDGDAAKRLLKVVDMPGVEGFNRLGEVLNFPELYEAYPELKKLPVRWMDDSFRYKGSYLTGGRFAEPCIFAKRKRTEGGKLSTLLHEVQHWIQHREGFAYGSVPGGAQAFLRRAGHPAAEEDNLYKRFAGEIEARNVQARRWMSADERAELPFNETLEHPGRAISYSLDEIMAVGFSVTSMSEAAQGLLEGSAMKVTRAGELIKDFNAQIANWNRVAAGKQGRADARTGAEMFGAVQALLSSARRVLPEGYRANVYTLMQWASVYAGMAETGQLPAAGALKGKPEILEAFKRKMLNETSMAANQAEAEAMLASIGEQKLNEVMVKVLQQVRGQLVRYAKDELWSKVLKVVDRAYAKDEAGKKPRRGKMAAVDYARLEQVLKLLRMDPEEVREEMNGLQGKISEATAERAAELEAELQDLSVFGGWSGMSLQQAMAAHEALVLLVSTGRTSWQKQLDRRKAEIEWLAREMSRALPTDKTVSGTRNAERTRLWRAMKRLPYGFMSYSQLMLALSDRLGEQFCFDRIQEMTDANAALLNAEKDRMSWMLKLVQKVSGKQGEVACEKWLADFDTPEDTKIVLSPMSWCEVTMTVEAAEAWLAAGKEERTRQWEDRRKDEDRLKRSLREERPMVPEELIPELRKAVKEYKGNKRKKSGKVTVRGEYEEKGRAKTLTCSRDAALYAILLHEQDDYSTVFVPGRPDEVKHGLLYREGLNTPAKIQQLYDFVGPAGLAYGYALRKRLQEQGLTVGQVWEAREGVPFKFRDNYFRASFDRLAIQDKNPLTDGRVNGMGGGKYGMLVNRVPTHQEPAKWDMGASMVFLAASLEQDNYIFTSHITDRWRKLLMQREFARRLQAYVGDDVMRKLVLWMDAIDGAPLDNMSAFMNLSHWQGFFTGAWAASVLNGNGYVLMKQSSALLHGYLAGYVPESIKEQEDGVREVAHRHIGFWEFLGHAVSGGPISMKEIEETEYVRARRTAQGRGVATQGMQDAGRKRSALAVPSEKLGELIEKVDVWINKRSVRAFANAFYAASKKLNEENGNLLTEDQLRQGALQAVGRVLELGAQPLTRMQKGIFQNGSGMLGKMTFAMKSESINKLGLMSAQAVRGERVSPLVGWISLGVFNAAVTYLIAMLQGDEDDEKNTWVSHATSAGISTATGPLSAVPILSESLAELASWITGERVYSADYARQIVDAGGLARGVRKIYRHHAGVREMGWEDYFKTLTALVRASGAGFGAFSRSGSEAMSSFGSLMLSAAAGANVSRMGKDVLTRAGLFEPQKKKAAKKGQERRRTKRTGRRKAE